MIIKSTEELAEYTRSKLEKSGLSHRQIMEMVNNFREKSGGKKINSVTFISHAIQNSKKSDSSVNGLRCDILNSLGFTVDLQWSVKRQKNS